jgi:hypothetical protein
MGHPGLKKSIVQFIMNSNDDNYERIALCLKIKLRQIGGNDSCLDALVFYKEYAHKTSLKLYECEEELKKLKEEVSQTPPRDAVSSCTPRRKLHRQRETEKGKIGEGTDLTDHKDAGWSKSDKIKKD